MQYNVKITLLVNKLILCILNFYNNVYQVNARVGTIGNLLILAIL